MSNFDLAAWIARENLRFHSQCAEIRFAGLTADAEKSETEQAIHDHCARIDARVRRDLDEERVGCMTTELTV